MQVAHNMDVVLYAVDAVELAIPVFNNGAIRTNSTNFLFGFTYKLGQGTPAAN